MANRYSLLAFLCLALLPLPAWGQPDPGMSSVPAFMRVIPRGGNSPSGGVVYSVTVRDGVGDPLPNLVVRLDFSACSDVAPSSEQTFPGVGVFSCDPPIIQAGTGPDGTANFVVLGSVVDRSGPGSGAGCVTVMCEGVVLGTASPAAFDEDGVDGLTGNDLHLWLCDFASGLYQARSDFSGDGSVGASDLSVWLPSFFASPAAVSAARCDGMPTTIPLNPSAGGLLKMAWNMCAADGGNATETFGCAVNTGTDILEASFVAPPGVEAMTGFEALVEVIGDAGETLPPWWNLQSGGCRATGMQLTLEYPDAGGGCPRAAEEGTSTVGGLGAMVPTPGALATNRARIRIIGAFNSTLAPLTAGQEYSLFRLTLRHNLSVGAGSCAGCAEPIAVYFTNLRLTQSPLACAPAAPGGEPAFLTGDFVINANDTYTDWIAYWQGVPTGLPLVGVPPTITPSARVDLRCGNPARDGSRIELVVPRALHCRLALYDIAGRQKKTLLDDVVPVGGRAVTWNGLDGDGIPLSSGYYVLRLETEEGVISRPLIHLR